MSAIPPQIASEWLLWILGVVGGLVVYVWLRRDKDIGQFNEQLSRKADEADMEALKKEVQKMSEATQESKVNLALINEKLGRIVADVESEKGTRIRANADLSRQLERNFEALLKQLDLLRMEIPRYGRRQQDGDTED